MNQNPTNAELIAEVTAAIGELQNGQKQAVEAVAALGKHEGSETAHGIDKSDSPLRKAVSDAATTAANAAIVTQLGTPGSQLNSAIYSAAEEAAGSIAGRVAENTINAEIAVDSSALNGNIATRASSAANGVISAQISNADSNLNSSIKSAATTAVTEGIDKQIADPKSPLNTAITKSAEAAIGDAVENGTIGGGGSGGTITIPTIIGPASAPIGHAISYTVSAASGLQNGSIASFRYKLGSGTEQTANATNSSATISITVPAGTAVNTKFTLTVVAVDNYGNERSTTKEITAIAASVTTPTLTSPAANAVVSPTSIALTSSAFAATGASDTHAASHWKICSDVAGANVLWQSGRNTTSKTSITATPAANALTPGDTAYAFVKHEGASLGEGAWSAGVKLTVASVNAPTISSPAAGATVYASGVTITTSAFACSGGISDTHKSTDWKITSDAAGNNVVVQALASANKTSHTFTGLTITDGSTYYLWARHNGTSCGASPWSAARSVTIKTGVTTAGGRLLYRHSSGKGTVMEFNDGQARKVLVLDAAHRGKATFGAYGTDSPLLNYASANTRGDWYLNTSNAVNNNAATKMTDAQINSLWSGSIDAKTAKQNCDQWMTYSDTNAVRLCRNVSVDGKACDVPNIQTLMRIFLEADDLDKLDPTVAANKTKALGSQNSGGFWNCMGTNWAWSSTEYTSNYVRCVYNNGNCNYAYKYYDSFVVPVLEL